MSNLKNQIEFKEMLRVKLTSFLENHQYTLVYDNQNVVDDSTVKWIFRLEYSGKHKIEIFNDDWRDYTEYFNISIDKKELMLLNLEHYESTDKAFEEIKTKLSQYL
jgi:hypothetical protein